MKQPLITRALRCFTSAAFIAAAGMLAFSAPSEAAGTARKGGSQSGDVCAFDSFNYATDGSLTINCTSGTPQVATCDATQTGAFAVDIVGRPSVVVSVPYSVTFKRTGGCKDAVTVSYAMSKVLMNGASDPATDWSFNGKRTNGSVSFAAGETSKSVTFEPGATVGYFLVMLIGTNPTATFDGKDMWLNVVAAPPPVQQAPGCTTSATYIQDFTLSSGQEQNFILGGSETKAFGFTMPANATGGAARVSITTSEASLGAVPDSNHELVINACPGDFSHDNNACHYVTTWTGAAVTMSTTGISTSCALEAGKKYYANVRYVNPATMQTFCPAQTCKENININFP